MYKTGYDIGQAFAKVFLDQHTIIGATKDNKVTNVAVAQILKGMMSSFKVGSTDQSLDKCIQEDDSTVDEFVKKVIKDQFVQTTQSEWMHASVLALSNLALLRQKGCSGVDLSFADWTKFDNFIQNENNWALIAKNMYSRKVSIVEDVAQFETAAVMSSATKIGNAVGNLIADIFVKTVKVEAENMFLY
jgi:hypothetical protein